VIDVDGTLYGMTSIGGTNNDGVIFSLTLSGKEHVLHNFGNGNDGREPDGGLVAVENKLYGTTSHGGPGGFYGYGVAFVLSL
jgi:uncharacterized repeat protein (TIGR03803 family)